MSEKKYILISWTVSEPDDHFLGVFTSVDDCTDFIRSEWPGITGQYSPWTNFDYENCNELCYEGTFDYEGTVMFFRVLAVGE